MLKHAPNSLSAKSKIVEGIKEGCIHRLNSVLSDHPTWKDRVTSHHLGKEKRAWVQKMKSIESLVFFLLLNIFFPSKAWRIYPPPEERSRKKISSEYINRTWSRKCSPTRGDYLKIDDEVNKVFRNFNSIFQY